MKINLKEYNNLENSVYIKRIEQKAINEYREKPYLVENVQKYKTITIVSLFLQFISALLAFEFFNQIIGLNPYINACISIVFVVGIEAAKRAFLGAFFFEMQKKKLDIIGGFFALCLLSISVLSSYLGAEMGVKILTDNSKQIELEKMVLKDSVSIYYDTQIRKTSLNLQDFENLRKERHKGWFTPDENRIMLNLQKKESQLQAAKDSTLKAIELNTFSETETKKASIEKNGFFVALLSIALELVNILCLFYISKYLFCVFLEASNVEDPNAKTADVQTADIQTPSVQTASVQTASVQQEEKAPQPSTKLGFDIKATKDGNKICLQCGGVFTYKIHNQKFCSQNCRVLNWETEKNKKLIFKK